MFEIATVILVLTALMAYVNSRYIGLPTTIGVMAIALVLSFVLVGLDKLGVSQLRDYERALLASINFSDVLMQGMLSALLFAGALHVDISELKAIRWQVAILAVAGTVFSTALVGMAMYHLLPLWGVPLSLPYCLLFGALISPTDPIAVMGILKTAGAPKRLELLVAGESLFNDGVGVVVFSLLLAVVAGGHSPSLTEGGILLLQEAGGGIAYGLLLGLLTYYLLQSIDSYAEEVLITLAAVLGGYALASHLHVSGPLAMVVVGLVVGNHGRRSAMSDRTRKHIDSFWELLDTILNAVLFTLIGLQVVIIPFGHGVLWAAVVAIIVTLLARLLSIGVPMVMLRRVFHLPQGSWKVLTWGGLRGGISVALALSLPAGGEHDTVLALTYCIVIFSILVQGLTIGHVAKGVKADS